MEPTSIQRKKVESVEETVKWSMYNVVVDPTDKTHGKYLLYNTASGKLITSDKPFSHYQEFYSNPAPILPKHQKLRDMGFLVAGNVNELSKTRYDLQKSFKGHQHLIILPTEKCNFRCVYCYEDFLKGKMSVEMQDNLVDFVRNNASQWETLEVHWFGGEPLTAYKVIESLSSRFLQVCEETNTEYHASMTTNGFLLSLDWAKRLKELGVDSYQITIDGTEEDHNANRHLAGGGNTYRKIINNLLDIKFSELNVNIMLRTNFLEDNADGLEEHIRELATHFSYDKRFSFKLFPVGKWGGPNDEELPICTSKDAHSITIDKTLFSMQHGLASAIHEDLTPHNVCYAANPNSLVIGSDGMLYKCTVAFDNPINHVGQLKSNGELDINYERFSQWISADGISDSGCRSCQLHPVCHGATCPLVRIENDVRPCPPAKSDLPEYIRSAYYGVVQGI